MLVDQVVTFLEMTSPDELRPGRPAPTAVAMEYQDTTSPSIRVTHDRVAAPYHWSSLDWSDQQWNDYLSSPHRHHWLAVASDQVAGLVAVTAQPGAEAEINIFGLVPEFVGRGFGAHILTAAVRLAWNVEAVDADSIRRVWLHTSSLDHTHALPNYQRRGFRVVHAEKRPRELPA